MIRSLPLLLAVALTCTGLLSVGARPAAAAPGDAIVVLGDSAAAGDGAGDYEPGTRGEHGDWCHRSVHAYVNSTGLAPEAVNLACSGAESADVRFGDTRHYTEGSQAQQLAEVARTRHVRTVVLQLGANDDMALSTTAVACIRAFLDPVTPPCRRSVGPQLPERAAATAGKVTAAVGDVREALRRAGYTDDAYTLVLVSYAAPVTERMVAVHGAVGCPYSKADAGWARTTLFPSTAAMLSGVAARVGARFLDLMRATEGFEACSHADAGQEWQRRLTVDPRAFLTSGIRGIGADGIDRVGFHLAQQSFHPAAAAHARIGRCLGQFVPTGAVAAACVAGPDGTVHLEGGGSAPSPAT